MIHRDGVDASCTLRRDALFTFVVYVWLPDATPIVAEMRHIMNFRR